MKIEKIKLSQIKVNPNNPRKTISDQYLQELGESIKAQGLLQPITVRPHGGKFQIVMGECRYRASKIAGIKDIDCIVREMDDKEVAEAMLVENLQRANVNPIEEARYVQSALSQGMTAQEVGLRIGKSANWVAIRIKITSMPESILEHLENEKIGISHVVMLAQVKDEEIMLSLANDVAEYGWTTSELRANIDKAQRKLSDAPWPLKAKFNCAGMCTGCPDRSDKQGDLFHSDSGAFCLNSSCWERKLDEHRENLVATYESAGRKIIPVGNTWMTKSAAYGYTQDETEIERLKEAGILPHVLIGHDCTIQEFWNVNDIPKNDTEEKPSGKKVNSVDQNHSEQNDAEQEPVETYREKAVKRISDDLVKEEILKKLSNPDETLFFDALADAIIAIDPMDSDELSNLASENESGEKNFVRNSDVNFEQLKEAICKWIVRTISIDDQDIETFSIDMKKIMKKAEKQFDAAE